MSGTQFELAGGINFACDGSYHHVLVHDPSTRDVLFRGRIGACDIITCTTTAAVQTPLEYGTDTQTLPKGYLGLLRGTKGDIVITPFVPLNWEEYRKVRLVGPGRTITRLVIDEDGRRITERFTNYRRRS